MSASANKHEGSGAASGSGAGAQRHAAAEQNKRYMAEERLRHVESITDVALSKLDIPDLLSEMLDRVRELLQTDTAAVLLLDDSGSFVVATAARGIEEEVRQGVRVPLGTGFAGRIAAERQPVILSEVSPATVANPILWRKHIRSMLGVPLINADAVLGVLHVGTLTEREFAPGDVSLLELAADRVAMAVAARTAQIDRAAATALQRSLAPRELPSRPGLDLAARYVAGGLYDVGGDWYDVFETPSGALGLAIGDVMGHGLPAAAVMGRLRSQLRAYALEDDDPGRVLERLDRAVQHFESAQFGTVVYAVLTADGGTARISCAGHLPPVLTRPGTSVQSLDLPIDVPLGVLPDFRRTTTSVELPLGGLLCLFTDGLVEDRHSDEGIDEKLNRLRSALTAEATWSANAACAEVMAAMIGDREPEDDVSMLVVKRLHAS